MAAKKPKKEKARKGEPADAPKEDVDALKWFIVVMAGLIVALGVFLMMNRSELEVVQGDVALAKQLLPRIERQAGTIRGYLDLIANSQETTLMRTPNQYFSSIFRRGEVGVQENDVQIGAEKDSPSRREGYNEIYWDITMRNVTRTGAANFMYYVEKFSPKAKSIEVSFRRNERQGEDAWDASFRIGYRVALGR